MKWSTIIGTPVTISKMNKYDNTEYKRDAINSVLDEYGLSREEFWKDPKKFLDNLDDKDAKLTLEIFMEVL